jgi:SAM-dependent methyltransferase
MDNLDIKEVMSNYQKKEKIWTSSDKWHYYTYQSIYSFIEKNVEKNNIAKNANVINLGSGGNPYCFDDNNMLHIDIVEKNIIGKKHSLVSNIEQINIPDNSFSCCLCVGSVLNYTDALLSIKEIYRILKPKGYLFLEFENSKSFEFYKTKTYNKAADIIDTFYNNETEKLWVYSERYVKNILKIHNFTSLELKRFHIITPLIYRLNNNSQKSSCFCWLDNIVRYLPLIKTNASNVIILAQKQ